MKKIILIVSILACLLVSSAPAPQTQGSTVEFASAVETYITVELMVADHADPGSLAAKVIHKLTVENFNMEQIYEFIWQETQGNPPAIFDEYYLPRQPRQPKPGMVV